MRRWATAIVFAAALAVRFAVVAQLSGTAIFRTPQLDSVEYFEWAHRIAAGDFTWPAAPPHGPGYPLFLGFLLFVARGSMTAVHLLQGVVGAITAAMICAIAKRVAGPLAGLAAGLFAALYAPLALVEVSILAEGLFVCLLTASLFAMTAFDRSKHARALAFFGGTALGLAIIVRPTAAILVPVYAYFVWRRARGVVPAIFLLATLYPVAPVLVHNWSASGDLLAIQSGGGMNFYIGNSPLHDGTAWARPGGTWDWLRGTPWRAGVRGAAPEDRYFMRMTLSEIAQHPGAYAALLARKLFWLTQTEEIRDSHSFDFFVARSSVLRFGLRFSVLLGFAAFGIWTRRSTPAWLLIAYLAAMSITVVALVAGMRYRLPILPALFVFAGIGASALSEKRFLLQFAIVFVSVFAVAHVWRHEPTHRIAEEWAMEGTALGHEKRFGDAIAAFTRALRLDPRLGIGWSGAGDVELMAGRLRQAETAYLRAIAADPHHARAYAHLALVRAREGRIDDAVALLQQAVAIRADPEAIANLAVFGSVTSVGHR